MTEKYEAPAYRRRDEEESPQPLQNISGPSAHPSHPMVATRCLSVTLSAFLARARPMLEGGT